MRYVIFVLSLFSVVPAFAAEPPKIGGYQRANPHDPRPQENAAPAAASTKVRSGDLKEVNSPDAREEYLSTVRKALTTWDQRIAELDEKEGSKKAAAILRTMRSRIDEDLAEIAKVNGKVWLDVKARIEARFHRMENEYEVIKA